LGTPPPEPSVPAAIPAVAVCAATGVTIPECSCPRCIAEQIRLFSPAALRPPEGGLGKVA